MFKKFNYLRKLLLVYGGIVTIVFVVFMSFYATAQIKNTKNIADNAFVQLGSRTVQQFEDILNEMSDTTLSLAVNTSVHSQLKNANAHDSDSNYFQYMLESKRIIQNEIINIGGTRFNNKSYNVLSNRYDQIYLTLYDDTYISKDTLRNIEWINQMLDNQTSKKILPVGVDHYRRTDEKTFSFSRLIQDEYEVYGLVDLQYGVAMLEEIFEFDVQETQVYGFIRHDDEMFFSTNNVPESLASYINNHGSAISEKAKIIEHSFGDEKYVVYRDEIIGYDMEVLFITPLSSYNRPINKLIINFLLLGITILIVLMGAVYIITKSVNKPIRQLRDEIEKIDYEKLSLDPKLTVTNNEIEKLSYAFNETISGIRRAREELIDSKTREVKANYAVLQAQINPHFMHNILSVIGLIGYQKNAPEIMDMCTMLTNMLKYTTQRKSSNVKIQEEIEHAETYLKLMKYRYLDKFNYSIEIDSEIKEMSIPQFTLQPVVENCFQHSLVEHTSDQYTISIIGKMMEYGWYISVYDNGRGFEESAIDLLQNEFKNVEQNFKNGDYRLDLEIGGMALINTYARLLLFSEGKIKLRISNREKGGSCVTIIYEAEGINHENNDR